MHTLKPKLLESRKFDKKGTETDNLNPQVRSEHDVGSVGT